MNDATAPPDSKVQFLAELMQALEGAGDRQAVIERYCTQRPDLAGELRALADVHQVLDVGPAPAEPPMPERLGEFRVLRRIGRGGMGEIYEGEQQSLDGRRVAIKVIRHGRVSPEARTRFLREQRVLARLHQTHIVPIHTAGEHGELQYFVMPYIEGAALHHVVRAAYDETLRGLGKTPTVKELASHLSAESRHSAAPTTGPAAYGRPDAATAQPRPLPTQRLPSRGERVALSQPYFRSVAEVMADAAEAVQHAHDAGFVHRDLKPSNIMIDAAGQCWIIDFGLAGYVQRTEAPSAAAGAVLADPEPLTSTGLLGTPHYMAPEQVEGKADHLSDVWGLGATLYELCTLRRPFEADSVKALHSQILSDPPPPPRGLVPNLPGDLAAICLKSLQKDPARRYASPREFGDDLRCWLNHFPTMARPARTLRRMALWSRRNPGLAAALGLLVVAVALLVGSMIGQNTALGALATAEKEKAEQADAARQAKEKQVALQEIQRLRLSQHQDDWSKEVWRHVTDAAKQDKSLNLRNQATACLQGMDARIEKTFRSSASSVAFHRGGKKMLMGGANGTSPKDPPQPARLWDGTLNAPLESKLTGDGPVAFADDGAPLQLVAKQDRLVLWNVAKRVAVREFPFAGRDPELALAANGSLVAASARLARGKTLTQVWDAKSGKLIRSFDEYAPALAFSPDDKLLAMSAEDGSITVRSLPDGKRIARLRQDRAMVMALAFGRDVRRRATAPRAGHGWLVAAGDDSGTVTVWDVEDATVRSLCRGSNFHVHAVAFRDDGMTLASAGRAEAKVWDIATGTLLLVVRGNNWSTGVAFSPDGRKLAVSSATAFDYPGRVDLFALENGRGIQSLRGLSTNVERVVFSPDDRLVAALSHDSRIAVWDTKEERLLHVFDAPKTQWVDNAAIAFSPDSKRLAFAGSNGGEGHAKLWNVADGKEESGWNLPYGLHNKLAFHRDKGLILFQMERKGGKTLGKVYQLAAETAPKPLHVITEFDRHIDFPQLSQDGKVLVMIGYFSDGKADKRKIKVFEAVTGESLFASDPEPAEKALTIYMDRWGRSLWVEHQDQKEFIREMPTGKPLGPSETIPGRQDWTPDTPFQRGRSHPHYDDSVLVFYPRAKQDPFLLLGIDVRPSGWQMSFNSDGHRFAWGRVDGTVNVADFGELQRQLAPLGLGW